MILSDSEISKAMSDGSVVVRPWRTGSIGPNSIDLHLSRHLFTYDDTLSTKSQACGLRSLIPDGGMTLLPGKIYLGSTVEWVSCGPYAPMLEGTSSADRLGLSVHSTAGVGDVGYAGHWTLELSVVEPLRVFGGEPVCQMILHEVRGRVVSPYHVRNTSSYSTTSGVLCPVCRPRVFFPLRVDCASCKGTGFSVAPDPRPQPSKMWMKARWLGGSRDAEDLP